MEQRISAADWPTFCAIIHERFSRDQHELLLCQLFNIRHTSTVTYYIDRFVALVEQLSSYTTNPDPLYFTTRFIDGLRDDIRFVILIQRPLNLDTACTLALLQEEALDHGNRREFKRSDHSAFSKYPASKGALPLPLPPPRPAAAPPGDDKKQLEDKKPFQRPSVDDRLSALRANRKARGLCVRCGDKWVPGHRCAPNL